MKLHLKNRDFDGLNQQWELDVAVANGRQGFWNITEDKVAACDHVVIWSDPATNTLGRHIKYTAPLIAPTRAKWMGKMMTVIHFNTKDAEWEEGWTEEDRPNFNRNGWVITD